LWEEKAMAGSPVLFCSVVVVFAVVGGGIRQLSLASSMTLAVAFVDGGCAWRLNAMAGESPLVISVVVLIVVISVNGFCLREVKSMAG